MNKQAEVALRIHRAMKIMRPSWVAWWLAVPCFVVSTFAWKLTLAPGLVLPLTTPLLMLAWLLVVTGILIAVQRIGFNMALGPLAEERERYRDWWEESRHEAEKNARRAKEAEESLLTIMKQRDAARTEVQRLTSRRQRKPSKKKRSR